MAINGTYKTYADFPMGKQEGLFVFMTQGDILTGTVTLMGNTVDINNGKVNGDLFEFAMDASTPMGKMKVTVNGAVEGDNISGTYKMLIAKMSFEGKRVS